MTAPERPLSVKRFELLSYSANGLTFVCLPYLAQVRDGLRGVRVAIHDPVSDLEVAVFVVIFLITFALAFAPGLILIWLAARRRKNWARWVLFSLFLFTPIYYYWFRPFKFDRAHGIDIALAVVSFLIEAAAYYFVFRPASNAWYRRGLVAVNA